MTERKGSGGEEGSVGEEGSATWSLQLTLFGSFLTDDIVEVPNLIVQCVRPCAMHSCNVRHRCIQRDLFAAKQPH